MDYEHLRKSTEIPLTSFDVRFKHMTVYYVSELELLEFNYIWKFGIVIFSVLKLAILRHLS